MAKLNRAHVAPDATHSPQLGTAAPLRVAANATPTSLWLLLRVWFMLGLQSFGGGMATLFLIQRMSVEKQGWLSAEEFTSDWALCQAAPGINLLCMTILIGRRVAGLTGALVALLGLLFPSVTLTILMTALYADARHLPVVQAALRGVVPATVGLGLLLIFNMARPLLAASKRESSGSLLVSVLLLVGSALVGVFAQLPVLLVLCSAGTIGGLAMWHHARQRKADQA